MLALVKLAENEAIHLRTLLAASLPATVFQPRKIKFVLKTKFTTRWELRAALLSKSSKIGRPITIWPVPVEMLWMHWWVGNSRYSYCKMVPSGKSVALFFIPIKYADVGRRISAICTLGVTRHQMVVGIRGRTNGVQPWWIISIRCAFDGIRSSHCF